MGTDNKTNNSGSLVRPFRELLVVNDQLIREKYFAEANDILLKIEGLESKIRVFHSSDQQLYDQWHQVTFRDDRKIIEQTQAELRELARFHNWVVATSHQLDLEMQDAYALMKDEARRFKNGTAEQRSQIERERKARDSFVESEVHHQYNEQPRYEDDEEAEFQNPLNEILSHLEDAILSEDREALTGSKERIDRIMDLSDDELEYFMREQEIIFLLFDVSLSWGESERDFSFFLRIWRLMSRTQKNTFSKVYAALTGQSIEDLVARVGGKRSSRDFKEDENDESDPDEFDEDSDEEGYSFDQNSSTRRSNRAERRHKKMNPLEEEKIKGLYRKLIRKLHPDTHHSSSDSSTKSGGWIKRAWEMVQRAYQSKDAKALDRLLKLTLLRTHSLDQLTIDEIREARGWLQKDLSSVEKEALQLKRSPAWGFSLRKNHSVLTQRVRKQFQQTLNSIQSEVEEIKEQHRFLEMLLTMESEYGAKKPRPSRRKSKKKQPQRRNPKSRSNDDNQGSFSF